MNRFLTEILEQRESVRSTLDYYTREEGRTSLARVRDMFRSGNFEQIIFTGMGSSYFASYAASCLFNTLGIRSYAMNTSELLYYHASIVSDKALLVFLSQSGESVEVVKMLDALPSGAFCIGITNREKSSLRARANVLLPIKAGREEMTSTKTYTSTVLVTSILGWFIADMWPDAKVSQIRKFVAGIDEYLGDHEGVIEDLLSFFESGEFLQIIGRGPLYATALQSELMFKEASKTAASGALGGEFRHGPMEMVREGFRSILFAAKGRTYNQSIRMGLDIAKYQGKVILITNKDPHITDHGIRTITILQPDEYLFSIQSIIPVQLMSYYLALSNGHEPGSFVHGGKVTTSE